MNQDLLLEMDERFENFMQFCEGYLDDSNKKLLDLAKKRYQECDEEYRHSQEFFEYIHCTQTKILKEESRFYVHLRDFLSILKENKAIYGISKRVHESSESESEVAFSAKRRKVEKLEDDLNKFKTAEYEDLASEQDNEEGTGFSTPCDALSNNSSIQKDGGESQYDGSDEEMERSPDNVDADEDDDVENEIWESEIVTGEDRSEHESLVGNNSELEESECEDDEVQVNRKEENDSDEIDSQGNDINDRDSISEVPEQEFPDSESEECSNHSRTGMKQTEVKYTNDIVPTSEDKFNDIGTSLHADTDNFKQNQSNGLDFIQSKTADNNEVTEVLNISSETEDKLKNSSSENFTEIKSHVIQDSRNEKWSDKGVCVVKSEENPACITIKRVKGEKGDENDEENPHLNHSSGKTGMNKAEKTDIEISRVETTESDNDDGKDYNDGKSVWKEAMESDVESTDENDDNEKSYKNFSKTNSKYSGLSSDDDDQSDAVKAKKFKEKCKKKYVISVGKKKNKTFTTTSPSKDHQKYNFGQKVEKERSPRKKHTPQNSPKCKKKVSPNKSPIIIFTDSESDDDIDMEGFKKKFNEKVKKQIQFENHITEKLDQNPIKKGQKMEIDNDSGSGEDVYHSGKENYHCIKGADKDKDKKEKKRVNLITEEYYSSKSGSVLKHDKENKFGDCQDGQSKDKVRPVSEELSDKECYKSNEKSPKQKESEREEAIPGPSSSSDVDNTHKKGSSRQIRKLEALLESIRNKIEKVRMRELDLDDLDSDVSDYLLEDKLQRKFMKVWDKLCELHKAIKSTGRPTDKYFRYQGTRYPDINRKLEKFINKKKVFPDYHDVRGIIMKVNREKKLHLKSREIDDLSREAFTDIGNQLQKRRRKDFTSTFLPHGAHSDSLSLLDDPALLDMDLKKKLDANRKSAKSNMEKVVEKYACLQYQVGDKTEEESEEEEEEEVEEPANIDDDLDQLSGVDNSDSDKDNADDNIGTGDRSRDTAWEPGPCLEIVTQQTIKDKNLESGEKSTFSSDNPDDVRKLTPVKSSLKRDVSNKDNKERHFCEQLGLFRTPAKEGIKGTEEPSPSAEDDNKYTERTLPPHRMTLLPHPVSKETDSSVRTESVEHCKPVQTDPTKHEDITVMILSDNEDDNEVISAIENETEKISNSSSIKSGNISELNHNITDSDKDISNNLSETSPKIPTNPNISISPKIPVSGTESSPGLENNNKAVVTSEADAKNISDVSNVTIITDDEDEELSISDDQSLGLKIVSTQHVSLSDISKLHGEEEPDVETNVVSGKSESNECAASLNSSNDSGKGSVKLSSVVEEESSMKSSPVLSVSKEKTLDKKKVTSDIDDEITLKINEVLNSEPDVMIIDDIENEVSPVGKKAWNSQVQPKNAVRKIDYSSGSVHRNHSNFSKVNRLKNSSAQIGSHSTTITGFPVSNKGIDNSLQPFRNDSPKQSNTQAFRQKSPSNVSYRSTVPMKEASKVNSPIAANSNILSPVSSKDWHNLSPQKSPVNLNRKSTGSKSFHQFPCNSNNTNKFKGENTKMNTAASSNIMRSTSNNSLKIQQNEFGRTNVAMSKTMSPINMNSKAKFTSSMALKSQQQKFGRDGSVSYSSTQHMQGVKQMNTGFKANPKSSIRMQSNSYQPYPSANKNWNAQSTKHINSVQKNYNIPQCSPRLTAVPYKAGGSNIHAPAKTNSSHFKQYPNRGINIQGQNAQKSNHHVRGSGFANSQQKFPHNQNQVKKASNLKPASFTSSKVMDDVVIIDCEEVEQVPVRKNKPSKHKTKHAIEVDTVNEVICIDDPTESEPTNEVPDTICIVSDNNDKTVKGKCKNTNDGKKTEFKSAHNSSDSPQSAIVVESYSKDTEITDQITEKSTSDSLIVDSKHKSEKSSVHRNKDENIGLKSEPNESDREKMLEEDNSVELKNEDNKPKENTIDAERTSSIEVECNSPADEEVKSVQDIFGGSLETDDNNECESIESCDDSETLDNSKPHDEVLDDEFGNDENCEYDTGESESGEMFIAVKLDTDKVNGCLESTCVETIENKLPMSSQGPKELSNKEFVACQETEMKSKELPIVKSKKNSEASVETRTDTESNTSSQGDGQPTSDDEEVVTCGMQDEDSISSTSGDVDSHPNVKLGPDIRNKLLQLEKAMVKSKPVQDIRSHAKPQDIIPPPVGTSDRAQWIEEDENASLIETYQEPDSTPYSLEDNKISSSSNENIIVLSDSE